MIINHGIFSLKKKLLLKQVNPTYYTLFPELEVLMNYLKNNYIIAGEGRYLLALRIRGKI